MNIYTYGYIQKQIVRCLILCSVQFIAAKLAAMLMLANSDTIVVEVNKCVRFRGSPYIHTCRSYVHMPRDIHERRIPSDESASARARRFVRFWASGGAKFPKMWDSVPWTSMNRRAKFDVASCIIGEEIRNRINTQTNSNRYIHTLPIGMCG